MWNAGVLGLLIICGFISIVLTIWRKTGKERRVPPEPFAWPVLGHLYLFSHLPHQALAGVARQHGPILGLRLGQRRAVVVSSPQAAREVLLTHDKLFADRPPFLFSSLLLFGIENGIVFSRHGPLWRRNRKICMLQLFTAKRLQELQYVRQEEIHTLLRSIHVQSCSGTAAVDLGKCAGQMSSRLIMRLLQSKASTQVGDENLQQLMKDGEQEAIPTIGDFFPSLSMLNFFRKQRMRCMHARIDKVYTEILAQRKESNCVHDDLLQTLLSHEEALTAVEIKSILHDMIAAGIHTTALTLEWAMAELVRNPKCLHRLQREIDTQVGEKKEVSDADLTNLSYLKCIVKEVFRLHPVLPLLVPRISSEECKVQGYVIPAKTLMFVNVWAMGRDEQVWPNANEFMPERFEGKDVDLKGQHFELLPFGSGRRSCLGLPLALSIVEVTLANLVGCFDWELPHGETHASINMDESRGIAANKATPMIAIPKPRISFSKLPKI